MKKSLLIILSIVFVLGFIATDYAFAADKTDITISGEIRHRGEIRQNTDDFNSEVGDRHQYSDTLVRLKVKAVVTPNTMGVIELETGGQTAQTYTWGSESDGNYKPGALYIRQAYIAHEGTGLLGRTAGFKVGHQLLKLGNGLFYDHSRYGDDAILVWITGSPTVSLIVVKLEENSSFSSGILTRESDDATAYMLSVAAPINNANVSADITYVDDQDFTPIGTDTEGLHLWNIGLRGDTAINGINLRADVELQTGKAKLNFVNPVTGMRENRKFKGYALLVGADYNINDITVGAEFAYGSGDKITYDTTTPTGRSGSKNEAFQTTLGADPHYTYVYEYRVRSAAGALSTGLSNTWYINVGASKKITPDLKVSTDIYYLRASQAVTIMGATNADGTLKTSKNIGTEIDGTLEYQIDRNLVYFIEGGYLWAGSAYDRPITTGNNESADNAYAVRHGVTLKF